MKNLNKKIGALALAGMVLVGGVAMSGVSAHANSNIYAGVYESLSIQQLNNFQKYSIKEVEEICGKLKIVIYDVSHNHSKIDEVIKRDLSGNYLKEELLSRPIHNVQDARALEILLKGSKASGRSFVRYSYDGLDYVFLLQSR